MAAAAGTLPKGFGKDKFSVGQLVVNDQYGFTEGNKTCGFHMIKNILLLLMHQQGIIDEKRFHDLKTSSKFFETFYRATRNLSTCAPHLAFAQDVEAVLKKFKSGDIDFGDALSKDECQSVDLAPAGFNLSFTKPDSDGCSDFALASQPITTPSKSVLSFMPVVMAARAGKTDLHHIFGCGINLKDKAAFYEDKGKGQVCIERTTIIREADADKLLAQEEPHVSKQEEIFKKSNPKMSYFGNDNPVLSHWLALKLDIDVDGKRTIMILDSSRNKTSHGIVLASALERLFTCSDTALQYYIENAFVIGFKSSILDNLLTDGKFAEDRLCGYLASDFLRNDILTAASSFSDYIKQFDLDNKDRVFQNAKTSDILEVIKALQCALPRVLKKVDDDEGKLSEASACRKFGLLADSKTDTSAAISDSSQIKP